MTSLIASAFLSWPTSVASCNAILMTSLGFGTSSFPIRRHISVS